MKHHYIYKLTAINPCDERKFYIGVRSCLCLPEDDVLYYSSSRHVKNAIAAGVVFEKEIIATWQSRLEANRHEIELHLKYSVHRNCEFFNIARATNESFAIDASFITKALFADADWKNKRDASVRAAKRTPEARLKTSVSLKKALQSLEARAVKARAAKESQNKPDVRAKKSASIIKSLSSSDSIARRKFTNSLPEVRARRSAATTLAMNRQDVKCKLSEKSKTIAAEKKLFCQINGISRPGKAYCNVDAQAFMIWKNHFLKENNHGDN